MKYRSRFWRVAALATLLGLPAITGCGKAEQSKTQAQLEESRLKHQETSRRELGK